MDKNNSPSGVFEISSIPQMLQVFELMHTLRDSLDRKEFEDLLRVMVPNGYRMFCIQSSGRPVCLAGVSILTNLYYKRHLWVYDLVTDTSYRSQGLGEQMMLFLEDFASKNACTCVALSSGISRERAHSFYKERVKYNLVSYVYKKPLL